jgi:hypothetical protein
MKILASLLMLVVVLHSACMGRCLGKQSSTKPPCHHEEETSKNDSNLCSEGPALQAKSSPALKCTLDLVSVPSVVRTMAGALTPASETDSASHFETASPPLLRITVLRI